MAANNPKFVAALLANQDFAGVPGADVAQLLQASSPPPPPAAKQPCKPPPPSKAMTSAQPMARGLAWVVPPPPAPKQEAVVGAAHAAISKQQQFGKHPGIVPPPAPPPRSEVPAPPSFSSASEPQPLKKARGPRGGQNRQAWAEHHCVRAPRWVKPCLSPYYDPADFRFMNQE